MELCSRCKKRPAVVFVTRLENGNSINHGLCIKCAREVGIKQVDDIMKNMGISDEDLEHMDEQLEGLLEANTEESDDTNPEENHGHAPALDFRKIFGQLGIFPNPGNPANPTNPAGGAQGAPQGAPQNPNATNKQKPNNRKMLNAYCSDLTKKAADGKIDRVIGRDRELERMIQILSRRQKNNPCLIGEPGVGKTALAEALALKIVSGNIPAQLEGKELFQVDMTAMVAGTQFRGQFESRMKALLEEVKKDGNIILVIDEIHSIANAGDAEGAMNAGNILKPSLSKGEIQIIGATTLNEYRKYIEKDSALERRFQPIIIEEPSIEDSIKILKGIKDYYESFHSVKVPEYLLEKIVNISERYITDRFLPDKAIDLLDESCAYLNLRTPVISESKRKSKEFAEVEAKIAELEEKLAKAENNEELYAEIANLKSQSLKLAQECDSLRKKCAKIKLSENDIAQVIEIWTGIPSSSITETEFEKIDKLDEQLKTRIVGQDAAIEAVCKAVKRKRAGISYKNKPVSFIFAGPTGVGKTELVKTLASELFHSPESLIRLDMSEFMEKHSVSRIVGSPPGYVGYEDAGQLTEKIRRKPYTVVLFDEIEKAHPDVLNILLQILDDGIITDAHGKKVNFENTIIVMTTNAGSTNASAPMGFSENENEKYSEQTMKSLREFLRPEFINRVDEIITFNSLSESDFVSIARIMMNDLNSVLSSKSIELVYDNELLEYIAKKSYSKVFGARNMRRIIQKEIEDVMASNLISDYSHSINTVVIKVNNDKLDFSFSSKELSKLK